MSHSTSRYLSHRALIGLDKVGDIVIPGGGPQQLPAFSETGCASSVDEILDATHPDDIQGLQLLLCAATWMPAGFIKGLLWLSAQEGKAPSVIGTALRFLGMGLKGVPVSLYFGNETSPYYQGQTVYDAIEYHVYVEPDYGD
ncbi:conserved hypothetical protein [gamma proteobacterium HTCC5015]|nr:conserved hypothetical protein [gamma proteobacterium HTCC5015]